MGEKKRDGSGRFSRSVDDADVLGAVRAHDPAATSEIAEELGISRQGADRRLRSLREDGAVSSKKIGASLVWFTPRERGEGGDGTETPDKETNTKSDHAHAESDALAGLVRDHMEREDLPPKTEHGRNAVIEVFQYLREHETAKTGELKDHLAPNYADQYATKKAMWESVYRYLEDIPGIDKAGRGKYAYAGDERVREEVST